MGNRGVIVVKAWHLSAIYITVSSILFLGLVAHVVDI
jgi:hypothetical protein